MDRRLKIAAVAAASCAAGAYVVLPIVVENRVQARLAERGFPDASVDVTSVGIDHLQLRNVHLQPGLDLGSVRFNRGLSLLWRDVDDVAIDGARVELDQVAENPPTLKGPSDGSMPFRTLHIAGSTLAFGGHAANLAGTVSADHGAFDVTIAVSEPKGWSARGIGRVSWGEQVTVNGHADIHAPKLDAGPYTLTDVQIPVTVDASGIRVRNAHANLAGGVLKLDASVLTGKSPEVVVHATGIRLAGLLAPSNRVTGTGVIDGEIALRADARGLWIDRGEIHARTGGSLQVTDAAWRKYVVALKPSTIPLQAALATALTDFKYDTLTAELAGPGSGPELKLTTRGRGRRNQQELDIAIGVRGVRDSAARLMKGHR